MDDGEVMFGGRWGAMEIQDSDEKEVCIKPTYEQWSVRQRFRLEKTYDRQCQICLCGWTKDEEFLFLPCGHGAHLSCLNAWFQPNRHRVQCPMCKVKVFGK